MTSFWSCDETGATKYSSLEAAIQAAIEGVKDPPTELKVYQFRPTAVEPEAFCKRNTSPLRDLLERLDVGYGVGSSSPPTEAMLRAERAFVEAVVAAYENWALEVVEARTVPVSTPERAFNLTV